MLLGKQEANERVSMKRPTHKKQRPQRIPPLGVSGIGGEKNMKSQRQLNLSKKEKKQETTV